MTAQAGELLRRDGKETWMQTCPLEVYWDANPPRPYMLADSTAVWRGYIGEWEIVEMRLYLTRFEATAWKTSEEWVGDDALNELWSVARLWNKSVATAMSNLADLPETATAANRRAARIVLTVAEQLLSGGKLKPVGDTLQLLQAAGAASWKCFKKEQFPLSLDTLFPAAHGRVFAAWYTGRLRIDEGELLDYQHAGFASTYEFTRLIEVRGGQVIGEQRRKNAPPPPSQSDREL
jgi:hypothetical protein